MGLIVFREFDFLCCRYTVAKVGGGGENFNQGLIYLSIYRWVR